MSSKSTFHFLEARIKCFLFTLQSCWGGEEGGVLTYVSFYKLVMVNIIYATCMYLHGNSQSVVSDVWPIFR